jgi:diguanylate cyclase (GGDEF)-like protein
MCRSTCMDPISALTRFERHLLGVVSSRGRAPFIAIIAGVSVWLSLGITTLLMIVTGAETESFVIGLCIAGAVPLMVAPAAAGCIARLLQALAIARSELHQLANTDSLTGVLNRRSFTAEAEVALARQGERHLVAMVDVDDFKAVNDRHGHGVGDRLLVVLAERLRDVVGDDGIVGRIGGDEFAAVVPVGDDDAAHDSLRSAFRAAGDLTDVLPGLSASVGTAEVQGATLEDALVAADRALYAVKRSLQPAVAEAAWESAV